MIFYYIFSLIVSATILYQLTKLTLINCKDWPKELNNAYIYNNQSIYGCQIIFPNQCPYKIGKFFQDITKLKRIKYEYIESNGINKILEISKSTYLTKNNALRRIGYPLSNKDPNCSLDINDYNFLKANFRNNIVIWKIKKF